MPTLLVRELEAQFHRDDIELTIAAPQQYAEIEEVSRGADPTEVRTPLTADLIAWLLDQNPCGQGFVVIARDRFTGKIIGHFVFYPWLLQHRSTGGGVVEIPVYLHVRLWVSRDFRRRGVFLSMTTFGIELLRRMGIGFAYTVPNLRSAPGFLKLGQVHAGDVPFFVRPLLPGWGWLFGGRPPHGVEIERRDAFDDRFDGLPESSLPQVAELWSPRRATLLNWRYSQRPDVDYEIRYLHLSGRPIGYLVTRRMHIKGFRIVVVCDFWTEESLSGALRVGLEDAARSGERASLAIVMGGNASPAMRRAVRGAAFLRCPTKLLPQPVAVIGGAIGEGPERLDVPPFDRWHVTPCDWDVF